MNRKTSIRLVPLCTALIVIGCLVVAYAQAPLEGGQGNAGRSNRIVEFATVSSNEELGIHASRESFSLAAARSADREAVRREELKRMWRGTQVAPDPTATGAAKDWQQKIASLLAQQDRGSARRMAHFHLFDTPDFGLRGWTGVVRQVSRSPEGAIVTVEMRPVLVTESAAVMYTPDFVLETYLYANDQLSFLELSEPTDTKLGGIVFSD